MSFSFAKLRLLAILTIGYGIFYFTNNLLTDFLHLTPGAHLVHLPSGIKILMMLIAGSLGAFAIFIASVIWGAIYLFPGQFGLVIALSIGSAGVPWLVCKICSDKFHLDHDLANLTLTSLFTIALSYAVLNSIVSQCIIYLAGQSEDLGGGIGVMFVGDVTGILIVTSIARWISHFRKSKLEQ